MAKPSPGDIIASPCNSCGRDTEHDVVHAEAQSSGFDPEIMRGHEKREVVVRCRGCRQTSMRNERWDDEPIGDFDEINTLVDVSFSPPRLWARTPDWLADLEQAEPDLKDLLSEVYLATNDKQFRLLAMGVRTALDFVMVKIVGDVGDFPAKLKAMVDQGHLSKKQAETLDAVIDAGSAASHRGFKPKQQQLQQMVNMMETIIRDHYLTGPMLREMKAIIPPRPPRVRSK